MRSNNISLFFLFLLLFFICGCGSVSSVTNYESNDSRRREIAISKTEENLSPNSEMEDDNIVAAGNEVATLEEGPELEEDTDIYTGDEENSFLYPVLEIIDGDTIRIELEGKTKTVRLIGIDTPETVHPTKKVQCFGYEASRFTKELLTNESVYLETDSQSDDVDKYGRLLRYVYLPNGIFVNGLLVEQGYAYTYTRFPFDYLDEFIALENYAKENGLGLWGDGGC